MTHTTNAQLTDVSDMFTVHRAFRREFGLMPRLVRSVAAGDTGRAAVLADHGGVAVPSGAEQPGEGGPEVPVLDGELVERAALPFSQGIDGASLPVVPRAAAGPVRSP